MERVERRCPPTAMPATSRAEQSVHVVKPTSQKPSKDTSAGLSAIVALLRSSQTLPSPTAAGLDAIDESGSSWKRLITVTTAETPVNAVAMSAASLRRTARV